MKKIVIILILLSSILFAEKQNYNNLELGKIKFIPDIFIGEIQLLDSLNIEKYLGKKTMERLTEMGETKELPHLKVFSDDKKQVLTIYFHPGDVKQEFAEFKVSSGKYENKIKRVADKEFITESGIKLGISAADLLVKKGKANFIIEGDYSIYHYVIDEYETSPFLQKYNLPEYHAIYTFHKDKLIEFKFGFKNP